LEVAFKGRAFTRVNKGRGEKRTAMISKRAVERTGILRTLKRGEKGAKQD